MTQKLSPQAKANKQKYTNAWVKANLVAITIKVRPQEKAELMEIAKKHGKTMKALIMEAVTQFDKG